MARASGLALAVALGVTVGRLGAEEVTFDLVAWMPHMASTGRISRGAVRGDVFDLGGDFGLRAPGYPELRSFWRWGRRSGLRLSLTQWHMDGTATLKRPVNFGGSTFVANADTSSSFDLTLYRAAYDYQVLHSPNFDLSLLAGLKMLHGDISVRTTNVVPTANESESVTAPVPSVGLTVIARPGPSVAFFGQISGMTLGSLGHVYDVEAGVRLMPVREVNLIVGYRLFEFKGQDDDDYLKLRLDGPFGALRINY